MKNSLLSLTKAAAEKAGLNLSPSKIEQAAKVILSHLPEEDRDEEGAFYDEAKAYFAA